MSGRDFTDDSAAMSRIDASLTWVNALPLLVRWQMLWTRTVGDQNLPRFAVNDCFGVPLAFGDAWS